MSARKLKVVLTRRLPDAVETRMRELFDAELNLKDQPMDRAALQAAVRASVEVLGSLKATGSLDAVHDKLASFEERQAAVAKDRWDALEQQFAAREA